MGLIGGWLTAVTGGIAAAFLGHAITRFAVFLCTGHIGQTRPKGREVEEIEERRRPPKGWRVIGSTGVRLTGSLTAPTRAAAPPVALYVHVPFCVSLCPYCDFVVVAGAAARGPRSRVAGFVDALVVELELARRRPRRALRTGRPAPATSCSRCTSAAARRRCCRSTSSSASWPWSASASGWPPAPRSPWRRTPGPTSGATRRPSAAPASPACRSAPSRSMTRSCAAWAAGTARRTSREAVADARAAGIPSLNLDLLYDIPDGRIGTWMATVDGALALAPDHLSLYALTLDDPDAEGLTGEGGDHLPTTAGARRWREAARPRQDEDRAAGAYHHAVVSLAAAGYRGYEISNWARRGHASRHNLAYWQRRPHEAVGPGAHAFDGLTRRWNAARLDGYVAALAEGRLPPGGEDAIDPQAAAVEALILGLRLDTGIPLAAASAAAARGPLRVGPGPRARGRHARRPHRAHDPRPAAVQRVVQPPRLRRRGVTAVSLTLPEGDCYHPRT